MVVLRVVMLACEQVAQMESLMVERWDKLRVVLMGVWMVGTKVE